MRHGRRLRDVVSLTARHWNDIAALMYTHQCLCQSLSPTGYTQTQHQSKSTSGISDRHLPVVLLLHRMTPFFPCPLLRLNFPDAVRCCVQSWAVPPPPSLSPHHGRFVSTVGLTTVRRKQGSLLHYCQTTAYITIRVLSC